MKISKAQLDKIIREELDLYLESNLEEKNLLKKAAAGALAFGIGAGAAQLTKDKIEKPPEQVQVEPEEQPGEMPKKELNTKFKLVNGISNTLEKMNPAVYNDNTIQGRAAKAIAAMLSGVEVYGTMKSPSDMFTMMGGGDRVQNRMQGFAQFDTKYHKEKINTPAKYVDFFTKTIKGQIRFPNSKQRLDAVSDLVEQINNGSIKKGEDLIRWARTRKFGGSNWEGIDIGWGRVPGLAQSLVDYVKEDSSI